MANGVRILIEVVKTQPLHDRHIGLLGNSSVETDGKRPLLALVVPDCGFYVDEGTAASQTSLVIFARLVGKVKTKPRVWIRDVFPKRAASASLVRVQSTVKKGLY